MDIQGLFGVVATADMDRSEAFYTALFGRGPDDRPMAGLVQWRNLTKGGAAIQIVEDAEKAGSSMLTIITPDMDATRATIEAAGLAPGPDVAGDFGIIVQLDDPDGNRLRLAEPPKGMGE